MQLNVSEITSKPQPHHNTTKPVYYQGIWIPLGPLKGHCLTIRTKYVGILTHKIILYKVMFTYCCSTGKAISMCWCPAWELIHLYNIKMGFPMTINTSTSKKNTLKTHTHTHLLPKLSFVINLWTVSSQSHTVLCGEKKQCQARLMRAATARVCGCCEPISMWARRETDSIFMWSVWAACGSFSGSGPDPAFSYDPGWP